MKVFKPNTENHPFLQSVEYHTFPFTYEEDKWEFVDDIESADIIHILNGFANEELETVKSILKNVDMSKKTIILTSLTHFHESVTVDVLLKCISVYDEFTDNIFLVHSHNKMEHDKFIYINYPIIETSSYFFNFDDIGYKNKLVIGSASSRMYKLSEIKPKKANKKFIITSKLHDHEYRSIFRAVLRDWIDEDDTWYNKFGQYSDPNDVILENEEYFFDPSFGDPVGASANVIANKYYDDTYISVYVETIVPECDSEVVTEKTFVPLAKGHFILPFGYPGIVEDIKSYGFILPEWIDYSYDTVQNDIVRMNIFCASLKKLRQLSLDELRKLHENDIPILKHNRDIIRNWKYDSLYEKVKDRVKI